MPDALLDKLSNSETGQPTGGFAIAPGVVTNNVDAIGEGRVQVKVPTRPSFEPWAAALYWRIERKRIHVGPAD